MPPRGTWFDYLLPFLRYASWIPGIGRYASSLQEGIEQYVEKQIAAHQFSEHTKVLQEISQRLASFSRLEIYNQLTVLFMATAVALIKRLADDVSKISGSLAGIEQNLESVNARGDYFPEHMHSYIRMMIKKHANDRVPHYFTVFNKGTQWHAKFEDIQRQNPLGPYYLGHKNDLDELCIFLVEEVRPKVDKKAVLHILVPTVGPLAIPEAITFPEEMRPFRVEGQLGHQGTPFVWLCTPEPRDRACLGGIGILKQREIWVMKGQFGVLIPFLSDYLSVETETQYFVDPLIRVQGTADLLVAGGLYVFWRLEPPRILGQPSSRPWISA